MSVRQVGDSARLVVLEPASLRGGVLGVREDNLVIGRAPSCNLVLSDQYVGRKHAALRLVGPHVYVEDLGSNAGTKINGNSITEPTLLRDGDLVALADVTLRFEGGARLPSRTEHLPQETQVRPNVVYDIGDQQAGVISNVARDQYNSYVQTRESFLRDVAATKTKARFLIWIGLVLLVGGTALFGSTIFSFGRSLGDLGPDSGTPDFFGPVAMIGFAAAGIGPVLIIVGVILHVVATARRRRVEHDMPLAAPTYRPNRQERS